MLFLFFQNIDTAKLEALAKARDVTALTQYLDEVPAHNPFNSFKTGGAYAAGGRGWTVKPLNTPDGEKYIVFSTPLIEEDLGELLFKVTPGAKLHYVPEQDNMGVLLDSHDFDVRFDLPNHKLIATDDIVCHWERASHGKHFVFRISPTYTVHSMVDSAGKAVPYTQAGGIVAVAPGYKSLKFKVKYDGTNLMPAFDRLIGPEEATLSGSVWYLSIARRPAPYDITMHAPAKWASLAQGDLVSDKVVGEERITKYHMAVPVVWYGASSGPYKTEMTVIDGREYATMSQTMSKEEMQLQNELNADVIEFYSKHFVPYPFKRWTALDSIQFHGGPGALEAYSFATYPGGGLPGQDTHEPSHCWWGGILPNDYLRSLWNESFADFCQGLFARNRVGGNKAELRQAFVSQQFANSIYDAAPLNNSGDEIGPAAAALGYGKGADVLQMLEDEIGTNTMIQCMSQWLKTNRPRHIGAWEDFERVVNNVTGKDYKWFFDEWVRRPGYAKMSLSDVAWHDGKISGKITFQGEPYRIHADILIRLLSGEDRYGRIDTMQEKDGDGYRFSIGCSTAPQLIAIDPWNKILRQRPRTDSAQSVATAFFRSKRYFDPAQPKYMALGRGDNLLTTIPDDLSGITIVGSPETMPAMKPLCDSVGFHVSGNHLTYEGTTIDLNHGGAIALVDLPNGSRCVIALGTSRQLPSMGEARLVVFDDLGRPIRAKTDPVIGSLSYQFMAR